MVKLSIVSPVYRAEHIISELVDRIKSIAEKLPVEYEIILIEDGSPDRSWDIIQTEAIKDTHIRGIRLSRNFGQHVAITAELHHSSGGGLWFWIVICRTIQYTYLQLYEKALGFDVLAQENRKTIF